MDPSLEKDEGLRWLRCELDRKAAVKAKVRATDKAKRHGLGLWPMAGIVN
jgi:hypothetical protein